MNGKRSKQPDDDLDSDLVPSGRPPADEGGGELPEAELEDAHDPRVRLNKFLASQGVASRRKCDELILGGRVTVDGEIMRELGVRVDPSTQAVEVDGYVFKPTGARRHYYLLNKPKGVVCTNEERETRPRAVDLITDARKGRIFTVGRLDEESEGLIVLTNDGDFAQRIMHPRYGVEKTYEVEVLGRIDDEALGKIRGGVYLAEGRTGGARVLVKTRRNEVSRLSVSIREGMNREIRRAFARVGHKVLSLRRVRIGAITDRGLKTGRWRELTPSEIRRLLEGGAPEAPPRRLHKTDRLPRKPRTHSGKPGIARRSLQVEERRERRERPADAPRKFTKPAGARSFVKPDRGGRSFAKPERSRGFEKKPEGARNFVKPDRGGRSFAKPERSRGLGKKPEGTRSFDKKIQGERGFKKPHAGRSFQEPGRSRGPNTRGRRA